MPGQGRLGDKAQVQSDAHGCPGCPHPGVGPAICGSGNVFVNGRPALRIDDMGIHAVCCGPNMWTADRGSATVFINGKAAYRKNDPSRHCGGQGKLIEGSDDVIVGDASSGGGGGGGGGGAGGGGGNGGGGGHSDNAASGSNARAAGASGAGRSSGAGAGATDAASASDPAAAAAKASAEQRQLQLRLVDYAGNGVASQPLDVTAADGTDRSKSTGSDGRAVFDPIAPGDCTVRLTGLEQRTREPLLADPGEPKPIGDVTFLRRRPPDSFHFPSGAQEHTLQMAQLVAPTFELEHFRPDGAVLLPGRGARDVTAIDVLRDCLRHAEAAPGERLMIAGHGRRSNQAAARTLSRQRAESTFQALRGDHAWSEAAAKSGCVDDVKSFLAFAAEVFGYDSDPRAVDATFDESTRRALAGFRNGYNAQFDGVLAPEDVGDDGSVGVAHWSAFFDLFQRALAAALDTDGAGLAALQAKLQFVDGSQPPAPKPDPTAKKPFLLIRPIDQIYPVKIAEIATGNANDYVQLNPLNADKVLPGNAGWRDMRPGEKIFLVPAWAEAVRNAGYDVRDNEQDPGAATGKGGRRLGFVHLVIQSTDSIWPVKIAEIAVTDANRCKELEPINTHLQKGPGQWKALYAGDEINLPSDEWEPKLTQHKYVLGRDPPSPKPNPQPQPTPAPSGGVAATVACREHHPRAPFARDKRRRSDERAVEAIFFAVEDVPRLVCAGDDPTCDASTCELYDPREYALTYQAVEAKALPALSFISIALDDGAGAPLPGVGFRIVDPDGAVHDGVLDPLGQARVDRLHKGICQVSFDRAIVPPIDDTAFVELALRDGDTLVARESFRVTDSAGRPFDGVTDDAGQGRAEGLSAGPCQIAFPDRRSRVVPDGREDAPIQDEWPAATNERHLFQLRGTNLRVAVLGANAQPVSGAKIALRGPTEVSADTSNDGFADVDKLPPGRYQILVRHEGFEPSTVVIGVDGERLFTDEEEQEPQPDARVAMGFAAEPIRAEGRQPRLLLNVALTVPCTIAPGWRPIHKVEAIPPRGDKFASGSCDEGPRVSMFVPRNLHPTLNKVHVFFAAGDVSGNAANHVTTHALRFHTDATDWILLNFMTIEGGPPNVFPAQDIVNILSAHGRPARIDKLRLSLHSRGFFSLSETLRSGRLVAQRPTPPVVGFDVLDRIISFDSDQASGVSVINAVNAAKVDPGILFGLQATETNWGIPQTASFLDRTLRAVLRTLIWARSVDDNQVLTPGETPPASVLNFLETVGWLERAPQGTPWPNRRMTVPALGTFTTRSDAQPPLVSFRSFAKRFFRDFPIVDQVIGKEVDNRGNSPFFTFCDGNGFDAGMNGNNLGIWQHEMFATEFFHEIYADQPPEVPICNEMAVTQRNPGAAPVRAGEADLVGQDPLTERTCTVPAGTLNVTMFVPPHLSPDSNDVFLVFTDDNVAGDVANGVMCHALRSSAMGKGWLLIAAGPSAPPIDAQRINAMLARHGRTQRVDRLHLGCIGDGGLTPLLAALTNRRLVPLHPVLGRIVTFDADGTGARSLTAAVTTAGLSPSSLFGYRVAATDWSIAATNTIDLSSPALVRAVAALGYARLIQDARGLRELRRQPALVIPPDIEAVIATLPTASGFTARPGGNSSTLMNIFDWARDNDAKIAAMMGAETTTGAPSAAYTLVDGSDLARQRRSGAAGQPSGFYHRRLFVSDFVREAIENVLPR